MSVKCKACDAASTYRDNELVYWCSVCWRAIDHVIESPQSEEDAELERMFTLILKGGTVTYEDTYASEPVE